jgi:hypothetical protein
MAEANKPLDPDDINYTTNTYGSGDNEETESDDELEEAIEQPPVEIKEEFIKPKKSILPKILIGIVAFLLLLLIIGLVLQVCFLLHYGVRYLLLQNQELLQALPV